MKSGSVQGVRVYGGYEVSQAAQIQTFVLLKLKKVSGLQMKNYPGARMLQELSGRKNSEWSAMIAAFLS